jgi:hypothetical protein
VDVIGIGRGATEEFLQQNRVVKLAQSLLSESLSDVPPNQPRGQIAYKVPFTINVAELMTFFRKTDVRIGGFGPLFGGAVLVSVALMVWWGIGRRCQKEFRTVAVIAIAVIGSALAIPEPWWARYAPQLWLFPLLIAGSVVCSAEAPRMLRYGGGALTAVIALNALIVWAVAVPAAIYRSVELRAQLAGFSELSRSELVDLYWPKDSDFVTAGTHRLVDYAVAWREVQAPPCATPMELIALDAKLCVGSVSPSQKSFDVPRLVWARSGFKNSQGGDRFAERQLLSGRLKDAWHP